MIRQPFREHHLFEILSRCENLSLPLDVFLGKYFRSHKSLGAKDRAEIAQTVYGLFRWLGLIDFLCRKPISWDDRVEVFSSLQPENYLNNEEIPLHVRVSFPRDLFDLIVDSLGVDAAKKVCFASNAPAPTTIRVNLLKTDRASLLERWKGSYEVSPCKHSPNGILFHKKINFFALPEFPLGLFEVQDEGSQLLAALVQPKPGDLVMDYCCGSGGKTLAFAPLMQNKGQIYLHDIRPFALDESRKRLRRAGVQNAQVILADDPKLKKLKKKMDWVLVDAPCSGTGTLRRNPDMKWKFVKADFERLVGQQRTIFEKALSYLKPGGRIIFGTCSILKEENERQVEHFIKTYGLRLVSEPFKTTPEPGEMDGFFGAVMETV